jgi:hypothetical protein
MTTLASYNKKSNNLVLITPTQRVLLVLVLLQGDGWKITPPLKEDMSEASSSCIREIVRCRSVPLQIYYKSFSECFAEVKMLIISELWLLT